MNSHFPDMLGGFRVYLMDSFPPLPQGSLVRNWASQPPSAGGVRSQLYLELQAAHVSSSKTDGKNDLLRSRGREKRASGCERREGSDSASWRRGLQGRRDSGGEKEEQELSVPDITKTGMKGTI